MSESTETVAAPAPAPFSFRAKVSSALGRISADDGSRYAINGVLLIRAPTEKDDANAYGFATDGRALAVVNGCRLEGVDSALLPAELLRSRMTRSEESQHAREIHGEASSCKVWPTGKYADTPNQAAQFPQCASILRAAAKQLAGSDDYACVTLNAELLAELVSSLTGGRAGAVSLLIPLRKPKAGEDARFTRQSGKPIIVSPHDVGEGDGRKPAPGAVGVLMPVSQDDPSHYALAAVERLEAAAKAMDRIPN